MLKTVTCAKTVSPPPERDQLIRAHLALVNFLVERMARKVPAYMMRDEMRSAAMIGLLDAASRFNPALGILFTTFAEQRIRGAILDEARRIGWFSRTMLEKRASLAETFARLEHRLGRSPEEAEVAEAIDLDLPQYHQLRAKVGLLGVTSLQETLDPSGEGAPAADVLEDLSIPNPEQSLLRKEFAREMSRLLRVLSEKEQQVIGLFYYEELSQKEIAETLGLSRARVSQLHSQALSKLKRKLFRAGIGPSRKGDEGSGKRPRMAV